MSEEQQAPLLCHRNLSVQHGCDFPSLQDKSEYKKQLKLWQKRLLHVQQAYYHQKRRAIIVFEGWDASGKGGAIRRVTEHLDPRGYQVHPIGPPSKEEQGRHYLYRFQTRLPLPGSLCLFDRSYYGRVLVERVDSLVTVDAWQRAYREINEFERLLIDDGVKIIKLFLHISAGEQLKRFEERLHNPHKRWKLTSEDLVNRAKRDQYIEATDQMFALTDTFQAPWQLIPAEHKWFARVEVLKTLVSRLSEGVTVEPPPIDERVVAMAESQLGIRRPHN
ncbi:polyphosphate kinase [Alteromonas aestuariivivens]|uniref:Polyphosphate kinase n=1 Tax=Alteromonas aestuariivivens TaxID=1938339 RepID=A0A3D8MFC5_9ALTE|nr:polyphosphate kinase [Alteromonas aestuariivivens]RDV29310.1 polyphosphate kinase [Alteromonas aestuariivivens]